MTLIFEDINQNGNAQTKNAQTTEIHPDYGNYLRNVAFCMIFFMNRISISFEYCWILEQ